MTSRLTQFWLWIATGEYSKPIRRSNSCSDMLAASCKAALLRFWFQNDSRLDTLHIATLTTISPACVRWAPGWSSASKGWLEDEGWRIRKDGSRFWANVVITAITDHAGKLLGFAKVTRDLSERKNAEETLRHSEQQLRALFEFSPSDKEGRIKEVNARVESFFGYNRNDLLGQSIDILVPERFRNAHSGHRKGYGEKPRIRPMGAGVELYGRRKDGSEFPVDIMLGPVETAAGPMVLSVIRDISEKKEAEEALRRSEQERHYLEEELSTGYKFEEIIGGSTGLKRVLKEVETVAESDATVLILGETGTGKDLIARAIHQLSSRRGRTLVKLNCAAIPTGLLESELFGHEKGAFTRAIAQKIGRLELADKGTLFWAG